MTLRRILSLSAAVVVLAVIAYSGYRLWDINSGAAREARLHSEVLQYKPTVGAGTPAQPATDEPAAPAVDVADVSPAAPTANPGVASLRAAYPDAVGWLTIPNTRIDYPFVQSYDNEFYLRRSLNQESMTAGTVFMDYRNAKDFSDFNTVIYGHNMNNGSMFGTLKYFNDRQFFDANTAGTLFLADRTYKIEFFAFDVIESNDPEIYGVLAGGGVQSAEFLDYVRTTARFYRDVGVTADDRLVTLSTCNYEFDNARMVLIGKLAEM